MMFIDPIKWSSVAQTERYTIDIYNQARRFDDGGADVGERMRFFLDVARYQFLQCHIVVVVVSIHSRIVL